MDESKFFSVLKATVESNGCTIIDMDMENHYINLDGPDDAIAACVKAIGELAGDKPSITTIQ